MEDDCIGAPHVGLRVCQLTISRNNFPQRATGFSPSSKKLDFWPKNGHTCPKIHIFDNVEIINASFLTITSMNSPAKGPSWYEYRRTSTWMGQIITLVSHKMCCRPVFKFHPVPPYQYFESLICRRWRCLLEGITCEDLWADQFSWNLRKPEYLTGEKDSSKNRHNCHLLVRKSEEIFWQFHCYIWQGFRWGYRIYPTV